MRTLIITSLFTAFIFMSGCKHPDNAELHPHVRDDIGGEIEWHPHVRDHYQAFESWASGTGPDSEEAVLDQQY